jgi:hypothetical protein
MRWPCDLNAFASGPVLARSFKKMGQDWMSPDPSFVRLFIKELPGLLVSSNSPCAAYCLLGCRTPSFRSFVQAPCQSLLTISSSAVALVAFPLNGAPCVASSFLSLLIVQIIVRPNTICKQISKNFPNKKPRPLSSAGVGWNLSDSSLLLTSCVTRLQHRNPIRSKSHLFMSAITRGLNWRG